MGNQKNCSDIVEYVQKKLKKASAHWCRQSCVKTLDPIIFNVLTHAGGGLMCPATLRDFTPLFFFFPEKTAVLSSWTIVGYLLLSKRRIFRLLILFTFSEL